jgi:N-acetylglucosamine kinase-like BadF-type ATPase
MSGWVLGVDGGGTKSHLAMFGPDDSCRVSVCGPLNHECLPGSYAELEDTLGAFLPGALARAGVTAQDVDFAVFGLAGVDTSAQHARISDMLGALGFSRFLLCNDAYLGVAAGCPGGAGVCAINGTGSVMAAVDAAGTTVQVGGIGALSDDCGGSGWYGEQVLGAVYNALFKRGEPTLLRDMLFAHIAVVRPEAYTEALTSELAAGTLDVNYLNRFVFQAAEQGDAVALGILERSAKHYAGGIAYLAGTLDFPADRALTVTLAGSVFVKERVKLLPNRIAELVRAALPGRSVQFVALDTVPVAGAVLWAARQAGNPLDMAVIRPALSAAGL